ncbi:MAG TPA: ABC transporter substrate-binding protein [Actinophytocola sp.]|uniref:ABC transporter substrate-binding protein n=1 Tax=Actinophytocola sp. TaxID=1872138 RepID=UPI002DDC9F7C|nr:ABC transporter substrate-binding protein [Actinophytocola sp.]HEV2781071.1 ABC transporter substrate-binding protein [Actinophytocola sp.]
MRIRSGVAAFAVLALAMAGCGGDSDAGGASGTTTIKVVSAPNVFLAALYVARDDGLFAKEGLTVEIVQVESGNDSIAGLASGDAQFADVGFEDLVEMREQGDDSIVIVHDILDRVTLTLVMRKEIAASKGVTEQSPLADRLRALRGLKIGITSPGAPTDTYMRYYLRSVGLNPDRDVEIIPVGGASSLLAALKNGQIDAYHLSPPTPYVAAEQGFGTVLIDGPKGGVPDLDNFAYTAWATPRQWADANPDKVSAFSRALNAATAKVKSDPEAVVDQILDDLGSDQRAAIQRTVTGMSSALSDNGCLDAATVTRTLDKMFELKIFEERADPAEGALWTNKYNSC